METKTYTLPQLLPYINWSYFFHAWGLPPAVAAVAAVHPCPACREAWIREQGAEHQEQAREAARLFADADELLRSHAAHFSVRARLGLFPAWSDGDDVVLWADGKEVRLPFLRQQYVHREGDAFLCLADFISPEKPDVKVAPKLLPRANVLGIFATATDAAAENLFPDDPYRRLLAQTLADRLAEAAAERLHEEVCKTIWGYTPDEQFSPAELFSEPYEGRRPAVGYPSLPDQSLMFILDDVLNLRAACITLTESGMMRPHAAVAGLMFGHPALRHFAVGTISEEQLADYARRRCLAPDVLRPFLRANLE